MCRSIKTLGGMAPATDEEVWAAALDEFRRGLTIDEALRVLVALSGEQRGFGQLLEGPRRSTGGEY